MINPPPAPAPAPAPAPSPAFSPAPSALEKVKDLARVPVGGGVLEPARVGKGVGLRFSRKFAEGGSVSSASKRADGCCERGKTKGKVL